MQFFAVALGLKGIFLNKTTDERRENGPLKRSTYTQTLTQEHNNGGRFHDN